MLHLTKFIPDHCETVVFDWNGTLLNDVVYSVSVTNGFLSEHDLPLLSVDRYRQIFRFPVKEYYSDLGFVFSDADGAFEAVSDRWILQYNAGVKGCDLYAQSEEFIQDLCGAGVPCAILSAAKESDIHDLLQHHGIANCFEHVFGLDHSHAHSKLERGRDLLDALGKDANKVLLIGDTDHDYAVASALGMSSLLLADGHQAFDVLKQLPCPVLETRY